MSVNLCLKLDIITIYNKVFSLSSYIDKLKIDKASLAGERLQISH